MSSGESYDMEKSFFYPINYNWLLNLFVIMQWFACVAYGGWGLFLYNDGGEMINKCFTLGLNGGMAEFYEK